MSTEIEVRAAAKDIESIIVGQRIETFFAGEQIIEDGSVQPFGVITFGGGNSVQVYGARLDVKATPLAGVVVTKVDYVVMSMDGYMGWSIKGYQGDGGVTDMVFEIWNAGGEDARDAVSVD